MAEKPWYERIFDTAEGAFERWADMELAAMELEMLRDAYAFEAFQNTRQDPAPTYSDPAPSGGLGGNTLLIVGGLVLAVVVARAL